MIALIDADILRYEIGHSGQFVDEESGEVVAREFDFLIELLEQKIHIIKEQTEADAFTLYLTNDSKTNPIYNRWLKTIGMPPVDLKPNYRNEIATVKPYKSTRGKEKPVHYENLTAYMLGAYDCVVANGLEADDLMAIYQTENKTPTIICSRDKDLRQVEGNHYSWECGKQREIGPLTFDKKGMVKEVIKSGVKTAFGGGELFFIYQLMVGDVVDTIPGCPKAGHVKAMKTIEENPKRKDLYMAVLELYREIYGEDALTHLTEQARLLWLMRALDDIWEFPYEL